MNANKIFHTVEIIDSSTHYSFNELCTVSKLDEQWIRELIEFDIIQADSDSNRYSNTQLNTLLKAYRLQHDLELNLAGIALVLQLLDELEDQNNELKALRFQTISKLTQR